jgi:hypothetical protein
MFGRPSLVRRLVILAAGWSLAVMLVSALVMTLLFQQAALRRFDQGLGELIDNLVAGATLDDKGRVLAPALTDLRALPGRWNTPDGAFAIALGLRTACAGRSDPALSG